MRNEEILEMLEVNVQETMERFMNHEELYFKFLKKMDSDPNFAALHVSLEKKNYEEAAHHAHTLKGVTANLGLKRLYKLLSQMVVMLRDDETEHLNPLLAEIEQEYEKSCKLIAQL